MDLRRTAMPLMLAASQACAQPAVTPAVPGPAITQRIFTPPPVQWDNAMLSFRPALQQTARDFANLTNGIVFGMSPGAVNAQLPAPYPGMSWNELSLANEYPGEVRYFGIRIENAGALRMGLTACTGAGSYMVFLFSSRGLFRMSYRLIADKGCPDTGEAAREIFARYVPIGQTVALSVRYRTGRTEVVDITDSTAGYLIPTRWRQGAN
ncbi:MAG: hypothetical protein P4L90_19165 [Rhodopila sp.]|nr:hypothetical protein [Rhodopila sp.]